MSGSESGSGLLCGHYICADDIENWPSGTEDDEKLATIEKMEALIEKVTKTHFYPKTFDIAINGNNKNRLFLPLSANILSVTAVYLYGILMDSSWYAWDHNSIFINPDAQTDVELAYRLHRVEAAALFPHGYNNVRVIGLYGEADVPSWVKQVAGILIEDHNDPHIYAHAMLQSERIGNYAYSMGSAGLAEYPTGVVEADKWLRRFRRGKAIIMAP
jgi:hypothetical protein